MGIVLDFVGAEGGGPGDAQSSKYNLDPRKIIAIGLNYSDHVAESRVFDKRSLDLPAEPVLFNKLPTVLIPNGAEIVLPTWVTDSIEGARTDYEAELGVVVGKKLWRADSAEAEEAILGYTCFNDVSQRNIQKVDVSGWFRGKNFDTFGPVGPAIVSPAGLAKQGLSADRLAIRCRLNGKVVQESNTSHMIFKIPDLLSYISQQFTLEPGDLVITGTPSGVGPLAPGDRVEVEIEGIGVLVNTVRQVLYSAP